VGSRSFCCAKSSLELGHVEEEDGNDEGEANGWEEVPIARFLAEQWWMLDNRQAAGADCHEVEPLPVGSSQLRKIANSVSRYSHDN
jgi:hypothetical protein